MLIVAAGIFYQSGKNREIRHARSEHAQHASARNPYGDVVGLETYGAIHLRRTFLKERDPLLHVGLAVQPRLKERARAVPYERLRIIWILCQYFLDSIHASHEGGKITAEPRKHIRQHR